MSRWGVWCIPPKGSSEQCGWLRNCDGPRVIRITFSTRAEAEKECDIVGGHYTWTYEPRRILEKATPIKKKRKAKR